MRSSRSWPRATTILGVTFGKPRAKTSCARSMLPDRRSSRFSQQVMPSQRRHTRATAFSHRGALCEWGCLSSWLDPAADDVNVRRTRELAEVMRPFTTDSDYVNQIGLETDDGSESVKAAYGANYERLVVVKNKYDPTNLFRHNQNIKPTG